MTGVGEGSTEARTDRCGSGRDGARQQKAGRSTGQTSEGKSQVTRLLTPRNRGDRVGKVSKQIPVQFSLNTVNCLVSLVCMPIAGLKPIVFETSVGYSMGEQVFKPECPCWTTQSPNITSYWRMVRFAILRGQKLYTNAWRHRSFPRAEG